MNYWYTKRIVARKKKLQPLTSQNIIRALVVLVVILSLAAGYYHSSYLAEIKKYNRLEDMYVRVRGVLGRNKTQQLIDFSYTIENKLDR